MLDGYVSEKEQIESIRKFWNEHGKYILIAIVIGLAIGFGWRYFHTFEKRRAENAAMVYQSIVEASSQGNMVTAEGGTKMLMEHFSDSPYTTLAVLLSAKDAVAKNDLSSALASFEWVVKHSHQKRFQEMARINSARILLSENNTTAAMNELKKINDQSFDSLVNWVKGDIEVQEHHASKARAYYTKAKNELAEYPPAVDFLDKKIAQPI